MATYRRFEDLPVWQNARKLAKNADDLIFSSGIKTNFKLRDQVSGSSGSVMDNIAEGFERGGNREFIQFLSIAKASSGEFRSQLYRALDCSYITSEQFARAFAETESVSSQLQGFIDYLESSGLKGPKYFNRPNS
jgi:four helix bundle protein